MPLFIHRIGRVNGRSDNGNAQTAANGVCRGCGQNIRRGSIKCPLCGIINPFMPRRRLAANRPQREIAATAASRNHNGVFTIYRNSDGSHSCDCPSFLQQKEVLNGAGYATCKHIRNHFGENLPRVENPRKATEWQKAALLKLGAHGTEHLTDAQAYFLFADLLDWQGIDYRGYEATLQRHGRIELLPYLSFGVEFEGGVTGGAGELSGRMNESGLPCVAQGYSHSLTADRQGRPQWKIVQDGSVHVEGFQAVEVVTPKLFGAKGIAAVHKFAETWQAVGCQVNRSCGGHVHFDAFDWTLDDMFRLVLVWAKVEAPVLWYLVSPSRRNGSYCKAVNEEYALELAVEGPESVDRYHSLNLAAYAAHGTIEIRLHQGTSDAKKIVAWAVFMAKLLSAVKNGLTHREIEPTLEGVFGAIGFGGEAAVPVIRESREYLTERYAHWKEDARLNPSHVPHGVTIDFRRLEKRGLVRIAETRQRMEDRRVDGEADREFANRTESFERISETMSVYRLQRGRPSRRMVLTDIVADINAAQWRIPSVGGGEARFTVSRHGGETMEPADTLSCDCPRGRSGNSCAHTMNVARRLYEKYTERMRTAIREEVTGRLRPPDASSQGR